MPNFYLIIWFTAYYLVFTKLFSIIYSMGRITIYKIKFFCFISTFKNILLLQYYLSGREEHFLIGKRIFLKYYCKKNLNYSLSLGGGLLVDMMKRASQTKQFAELDHTLRTKVEPFLYNKGKGKWIPIDKLVMLRNKDRPKHKMVSLFFLLTTIFFNHSYGILLKFKKHFI